MFEDVSQDLPPLPFACRQVLSGPHENFHYVIADPDSGHAAIVDPAFHVDRLFDEAEAEGFRIGTVLLTHAHWDHIGGLDDAVRRGAQTVVAGAAASKASEIEAARRNGADIRLIRDRRSFDIGAIRVQAIPTPGHQPEALCFVLDDAAVATGDTLFIDSCGRTDFPGGDTGAMYRSMAILHDLPDHLVVLPGHDYAPHRFRTIGQQRRENPALATHQRAAFDRLPFLRG